MGLRITPAFLDELRSRVPLAAVIGRRVKLIKKGRDHLGLCPFHNEKTPSFSVSDDKGFYHCFGCQEHGDVIDFVQKTENLSFPEAVEKLAEEAGMTVPRDTPEDRAREERRRGLAEAIAAAAAFFEAQLAAPAGAEARRYLLGRGLEETAIRQFGIGFAPNTRAALKGHLMGLGYDEATLVEAGLLIRPPEGERATYDRFRHRIMFPIRDRRGRPIGFGGRILGEGEPKYLNSPETPLFHKGRTLYNLDQASRAVRAGAELIVAEGYMDVIALVAAGFEGAVAPLGTALTEEQIQALWRLAPEPVLCFDGDSAGRRAAIRAAGRALALVAPGKSLRFALLAEGEDPDSLLRLGGRAAMTRAVDTAQPLIDLIWEAERSAAPIDTPERQAALKKRLYEQARSIPDGTVRDLYIGEFQRRLSSLFAPRTQRGSRPKSWQPAQPPSGPGLRGRHDTEILALRQQQALLAAVINHPDLIAEIGEDLGRAAFGAAELDSLRREVLKTWRPGLDSSALESHLRSSGFADTLNRVLARNVYALAPFARPKMAFEDVRQGWDDTWREFARRQQAAELRAAEREFAETMSVEAWARVDALRRLVGEGDSDGTE